VERKRREEEEREKERERERRPVRAVTVWRRATVSNRRRVHNSACVLPLLACFCLRSQFSRFGVAVQLCRDRERVVRERERERGRLMVFEPKSEMIESSDTKRNGC
jgi:hypothetical protein